MSRLRLTPGLALLPLRLFLGGTFVYAGVQKLADPGFLTSGAPTYIGTQLEGFSDGTPGGWLLRTLALPHPALAGIGVAVFEIAVGLLVFFGLFTRFAAAGGLALNVVLFLTASWNTRPYFLGPDIAFVAAWVPFVLVGAEGQPALDGLLRRERTVALPLPRGRVLTRRALVRDALGAAAVATLALAGGASLARGKYVAPPKPKAAATTTPTDGAGGGTFVAKAADVHPEEAIPFTDPSTGGPALLVREPGGAVKAFSSSCTHAGCPVAYRHGEFRCPCHGGVFDAKTGAVVAGPPPSPLPEIKVVERDGQLFAT
jgi:thiosulfate dehydrogenase [quinone] large subunit